MQKDKACQKKMELCWGQLCFGVSDPKTHQNTPKHHFYNNSSSDIFLRIYSI